MMGESLPQLEAEAKIQKQQQKGFPQIKGGKKGLGFPIGGTSILMAKHPLESWKSASCKSAVRKEGAFLPTCTVFLLPDHLGPADTSKVVGKGRMGWKEMELEWEREEMRERERDEWTEPKKWKGLVAAGAIKS